MPQLALYLLLIDLGRIKLGVFGRNPFLRRGHRAHNRQTKCAFRRFSGPFVSARTFDFSTWFLAGIAEVFRIGRLHSTDPGADREEPFPPRLWRSYTNRTGETSRQTVIPQRRMISGRGRRHRANPETDRPVAALRGATSSQSNQSRQLSRGPAARATPTLALAIRCQLESEIA